ncbi:phosphoribosyltransferase [Candidatus Uhrbacteria bacterium]|nr:phosphoribosyltransferase [Candidatus Uhrbacteria bacterium]
MSQGMGHEMLQSVGAVITDSHIVYASGMHGSAYVNKDAIYPHTGTTSHLCREIAQGFSDTDVDVVVGPVIGGVVLTQWVAWHLSNFLGHEVLAVFVEKVNDGNGFAFTRGYDKLVRGKNALVVEDVLTTGGSAKKVVELVRATDGYVVGLGALCNRGGVTALDVGAPPRFSALVNIQLEAWDEAVCSLCAAGVPINTEVGKGREFLAKKAK